MQLCPSLVELDCAIPLPRKRPDVKQISEYDEVQVYVSASRCSRAVRVPSRPRRSRDYDQQLVPRSSVSFSDHSLS